MTMDYNNGMLKLIVEDTGTGITEEEQQRVFGAFERLSNAAAKDGFGLGLLIVQHKSIYSFGNYISKDFKETFYVSCFSSHTNNTL